MTPEKYVMNVAMGAAMAVGFDQVGKLFSKYWHNVTGGGNVKQTPKQGFDAEGTFDPVTVESSGSKAVGRGEQLEIKPIQLTTSSKGMVNSRTYAIYHEDGSLIKYGVSDATGERYSDVLRTIRKEYPNAYGRLSTKVIPKFQAHINEKYLRSLHFNSTGIWHLDGMKVPYPHNLDTGARLIKP